MKSLCQKAMEILMEESNVQRVDAPVTVSTKPTQHTRHLHPFRPAPSRHSLLSPPLPPRNTVCAVDLW